MATPNGNIGIIAAVAAAAVAGGPANTADGVMGVAGCSGRAVFGVGVAAMEPVTAFGDGVVLWGFCNYI